MKNPREIDNILDLLSKNEISQAFEKAKLAAEKYSSEKYVTILTLITQYEHIAARERLGTDMPMDEIRKNRILQSFIHEVMSLGKADEIEIGTSTQFDQNS